MKHMKRVSAFLVSLVLLTGLTFPVAASANEADAGTGAEGAANILDDTYTLPVPEEPVPEEPVPVEPVEGDAEMVMPTHDLGTLGSYTIKAEARDWTVAFTGEMNFATADRGAAITVERGVTATVILDSVTVYAQGGPAILVESGAAATIVLVGDNYLHGDNGFPAIQVGYTGVDDWADVTLEGDGYLTATGGTGAAGIGGGNDMPVYGNITIAGGDITAQGGSKGAGIGSGGNNQGSGASYKVDAASWGVISIVGGTVKATGGEAAAGIGGGDHIDSGKISIMGGTVTAEGGSGGGAGIGTGTASHVMDENGNKGPGYYYADIEIGGSAVIERAVSQWLGAGIGGGYCADAYITISGGTIVEAVGGKGNVSSKGNDVYQGGPGIGSGYMGYAQIDISGGEIWNAQGNWSAPGIGYGIAARSAKRGAEATIKPEDAYVHIGGGDITAQGGIYAAGIGSGNGTEVCNIIIDGGIISATGGEGGAGIGSGIGCANLSAAALGKEAVLKYAVDTVLNISITGGTIYAEGGVGATRAPEVEGNRGASGIGSGALNMVAQSIAVGGKADVTAVAEGAKFAVDTARGEVTRSETSATLLQGTFMDMSELKGLNVSVVGGTASDMGLTPGVAGPTVELPQGYRSFAVTVAQDGPYLVASGDTYYVYDVERDQRSETELMPGAVATAQYDVAGTLSDNYFLYAPAEPLPLVWDVTFDSKGGSEVPGQQVADGAFATRPADPELKGSAFIGWYTDEALTQPYDFSVEVHSNTVLYAGWKSNPLVWNVTFDSKGGSEIPGQQVADGAFATRPADPELKDSTFTGWYTDEALTQPYNFNAEVYSDVVLYAGWKSNPAVDPGPVDPGPVDPGPVDPGPVDPGPANPNPVEPGPVNPGPVTPDPEPAPEPAPTQTPEAQPLPEPEAPEVVIEDEETPLSEGVDLAQPGPDVQTPPAIDEEVIILDEETPLGDLPQTGTTRSGASAMGLTLLMGAAASGLAGLALRKKERE